MGIAPKSEICGGPLHFPLLRRPTELPRWRAGFSLMREVEEQGGRREVEEQGQPSSPSRRSRGSLHPHRGGVGAAVSVRVSAGLSPRRRPLLGDLDGGPPPSLPASSLPPHLAISFRLHARAADPLLWPRGRRGACTRPEERWIWGIRARCGTSRTPPKYPGAGENVNGVLEWAVAYPSQDPVRPA
jgi:hypothetical protein